MKIEKPDDLPDELLPLWVVWLDHPANETMTFREWLQRMGEYLDRTD